MAKLVFCPGTRKTVILPTSKKVMSDKDVWRVTFDSVELGPLVCTDVFSCPSGVFRRRVNSGDLNSVTEDLPFRQATLCQYTPGLLDYGISISHEAACALTRTLTQITLQLQSTNKIRLVVSHNNEDSLTGLFDSWMDVSDFDDAGTEFANTFTAFGCQTSVTGVPTVTCGKNGTAWVEKLC